MPGFAHLSPRLQTGLTILGLSILTVAQATLNNLIQGFEPAWVETPIEAQEPWNPRVFKLLTFGQWPSAVDWLWIRVTTDPLLTHVPRGIHPRIYFDLQLASDLDPLFQDLYVSGADLLAVIRDDGEGARDLLLKGQKFRKTELDKYPAEFRRRFWGQDWTLPLTLAYVYLFELDDMPNASQAFLEAASLPGSPGYLKRLERRLREPGGQYEVGLKLLNFMISGAHSENLKAALTVRRDSLFLGQYLFQLEQSFRGYLASLPQYQSSQSIAPYEMKRYWSRFLKESGTPDRDPWGGVISVDRRGKLTTTTPRKKVFGLD